MSGSRPTKRARHDDPPPIERNPSPIESGTAEEHVDFVGPMEQIAKYFDKKCPNDISPDKNGFIKLDHREVTALSNKIKEFDRRARSLHNATRSISRLPNAVLTQIFMMAQEPVRHCSTCLGESSTPYWLHCINVCSFWRNLGLKHPKLWTDIRIDVDAGSDRSSGTMEWVARAKGLPLRLEIHGKNRLSEPDDIHIDFSAIPNVVEICMHGDINAAARLAMEKLDVRQLRTLATDAYPYSGGVDWDFENLYGQLPPGNQMDRDPDHQLQQIGDGTLVNVHSLRVVRLHVYDTAQVNKFGNLRTLEMVGQSFVGPPGETEVSGMVQAKLRRLLRDNPQLEDITFGNISTEPPLREGLLARRFIPQDDKKALTLPSRAIPLDHLGRLQLVHVSFRTAWWLAAHVTSTTNSVLLEIVPREDPGPVADLRDLLAKCVLGHPGRRKYHSAILDIRDDNRYVFTAVSRTSVLRIDRMQGDTGISFAEEMAVIAEILGSVTDLRLQATWEGQDSCGQDEQDKQDEQEEQGEQEEEDEPEERNERDERRIGLAALVQGVPKLQKLFLKFNEAETYSHILAVLRTRFGVLSRLELNIVGSQAFEQMPFYESVFADKLKDRPSVRVYGIPMPEALIKNIAGDAAKQAADVARQAADPATRSRTPHVKIEAMSQPSDIDSEYQPSQDEQKASPPQSQNPNLPHPCSSAPSLTNVGTEDNNDESSHTERDSDYVPSPPRAQMDPYKAFYEKMRIAERARLKWLREMMEQHRVRVHWDLKPPQVQLPVICSDEMRGKVGRWPAPLEGKATEDLASDTSDSEGAEFRYDVGTAFWFP